MIWAAWAWPPIQSLQAGQAKEHIRGNPRMFKRDYRDMIGGALLAIGGLSIALFSFYNYDIGTLRRMGPGMFPMGLGYLLAGFGAWIFATALFRRGDFPQVRIWSPLFVLLGTGSFVVLIRPFGLIPAVLAVVVISSLAELKFRPVTITVLASSLSVLAWLIFKVGLRLPLQLFKWPF